MTKFIRYVMLRQMAQSINVKSEPRAVYEPLCYIDIVYTVTRTSCQKQRDRVLKSNYTCNRCLTPAELIHTLL